MVGIDGLVEVRQVAARAVLRRAGELAVDVALRRTAPPYACRSAGTSSPCCDRTSLPSTAPSYGRLWQAVGNPAALWFGLTVLLKSVRWQRRAVLRGAGELAVDVARGALHRRMLAGQRELRRRVVIELRARPLRRRMAALAVVGNPAALWFGLTVLLKSVRWQLAQSCAVPANLPLTWHEAHCTAVCLPVSGNFVVVL